MNTISRYLQPALLTVALVGFFAVANGAWAADSAATNTNVNARNIYGNQNQNVPTNQFGGSNDEAGNKVIQQVYNIIKFAYVFFYAIAVLLVAQAWLQFKQQKYDVMFASMGAALGLFLTPALIDFIHGLGAKTGQ